MGKSVRSCWTARRRNFKFSQGKFPAASFASFRIQPPISKSNSTRNRRCFFPPANPSACCPRLQQCRKRRTNPQQRRTHKQFLPEAIAQMDWTERAGLQPCREARKTSGFSPRSHAALLRLKVYEFGSSQFLDGNRSAENI